MQYPDLNRDDAPRGATGAGIYHEVNCNARRSSVGSASAEAHGDMMGWTQSNGTTPRFDQLAPCGRAPGITCPGLKLSAMKSEKKTLAEIQKLPGSNMRGWPLQVLGVKPLELHSAKGAHNLP